MTSSRVAAYPLSPPLASIADRTAPDSFRPGLVPRPLMLTLYGSDPRCAGPSSPVPAVLSCSACLATDAQASSRSATSCQCAQAGVAQAAVFSCRQQTPLAELRVQAQRNLDQLLVVGAACLHWLSAGRRRCCVLRSC